VMNKAEILFLVANNVALVGWLLLVFGPRWSWTGRLVHSGLIPGLLAIGYTILIVTTFGNAEGGFGSLAELMKLFRSEWSVLTGWIHYLAFDLFIGAWELRDSRRVGLAHWKVVPCLLFTFLLGPIGLLGYLILRRLAGQQSMESR
jgi:hypothetical protein